MSFGEAFGELLRDLGGSGASPRGVCSQCFRQGGFRRVLESDLVGFRLEKGAREEPKRVPRGPQNRDVGRKNGYKKRFKYTLRLRRDF